MPEDWISVVVGDVKVGMVAVRFPLIIATEGISREFAASSLGGILILVPSLDAPVLECDVSTLEDVFGAGGGLSTFRADRFSANDLWFATV
ncbi:hypothetical protein ACWFQ8_27650 [Streptomyces sp. NPDC055254]